MVQEPTKCQTLGERTIGHLPKAIQSLPPSLFLSCTMPPPCCGAPGLSEGRAQSALGVPSTIPALMPSPLWPCGVVCTLPVLVCSATLLSIYTPRGPGSPVPAQPSIPVRGPDKQLKDHSDGEDPFLFYCYSPQAKHPEKSPITSASPKRGTFRCAIKGRKPPYSPEAGMKDSVPLWIKPHKGHNLGAWSH